VIKLHAQDFYDYLPSGRESRGGDSSSGGVVVLIVVVVAVVVVRVQK